MFHARAAVFAASMVAFLGVFSGGAQASLVPFAGFNQTSGGTPITFDQGTGTVSGTAAGFFNFANLGTFPTPELNAPINATFQLTMQTTQPVQDLGGGNLMVQYDSVSIILTANNPIAGRTNLLTMTASNVGGLVEAIGGTTLDYGGNATNPAVTFSSDFLSFAPSYLGLFNIGFITSQGISVDPTSGFVASNTASMNAFFAVDPAPAVPEPSSFALIAFGLLTTSMLARRRPFRVAA